MSDYRQPDFLSDADVPRERVRCPVHGFIRYSENERRLIDHPLFQRLRHIRQLALTEYVYPGATHTRFEHSLGVMEVASRAFDALASRHGARMAAIFSNVAGFEDRTLALARQYVRVAALLHDVGHTSYSHAVEHVLNDDGQDHEALTQTILLTPELFGALLVRLYGEPCPVWVAWILKGERIVQGENGARLAVPLPPQLKLLKDLVSGQMDADRTDYLLRDSHHCGVDYGRFDHRRMIESLELHEDLDGELQLALDRGGIHTFEGLILARYQMNTQVYFHRLRRIYDYYLQEYFRSLGERCPKGTEALIAATDTRMSLRIERDAEEGDPPTREWARRIVYRRHHRLVHETGDDADGAELRRSRRIFQRLEAESPDHNWLQDLAKTSNHKLLVPGDSEERGRVDLRVIGRGGSAQPVGEVSRVLARIPAHYQCNRIFADVDRDDRAARQELEARANQLWREV